ncbi:MAG TPA: NADH-quinone oxidoreductase subunit NuoI [Terriglobales bacterium]|nr:NADH-quinone oxidoreductase subunit NuoI [Terriglobales bacterium]
MIKEMVEGLSITLRKLFSRTVTVQYPEQRPKVPPRYRARIVLTRDPSGEERCVACYLCSAVCPTDCITIVAAEREDHRRYPEAFRINFNRCIFCGLCAEACPTLALQMSTDFEMSEMDPRELIYEKEDLLIEGGGKYPDYSFWEEAGTNVTHAMGHGLQDAPPSDPRSNLP